MDAITIQILRNKVASLVDEMHYHFYRSGYSTIIRESRDFSCVILDREGRLIVAPPMFFHAPVYRHLVRRILEVYGGERAIKAGDVFVSNHPYEGGLPHVSDMAFLAPVFAAGEIVAFAGSIAHKADVGGAVAGSTSADATEMFQEGLLVPPIKIVEAGVGQTDVERIILTNSRQPALTNGRAARQRAVQPFRRGHGDGRVCGHPQGSGRRAARGGRKIARGRILGRGFARQRRRGDRPSGEACRDHRRQGRNCELRFL
ncbi:MAG: hydantoinase B/oxoprolinase family protein [Alphaproteobacteria bacterium]|nr:MAG: hydantoinase B/oxoprolinase family protein [Alphaproteobacteria bacterium]